MHENEQLIHTFYQAFQQKDYKTMQSCYANEAIFSDAVFKNLDAKSTRAMWEMLLRNGKDLSMEFSGVSANENTGKAHWEASYLFSATGRKVVNRIDAEFEFKDGLIIKHTDHFSFYAWSKQALGTIGLLLGWTSFLNKKITAKAMNNLRKFQENN